MRAPTHALKISILCAGWFRDLPRLEAYGKVPAWAF